MLNFEVPYFFNVEVPDYAIARISSWLPASIFIYLFVIFIYLFIYFYWNMMQTWRTSILKIRSPSLSLWSRGNGKLRTIVTIQEKVSMKNDKLCT